MRSLRTEAN